MHHVSSETPLMIPYVCDASIRRFYSLPTPLVSIPTSNPTNMQITIPILSSESKLWSVLALPLRTFSTSSNSTSTFVSIRHTSSALALPRNRAAPSINSWPPHTKKTHHLSKKGHMIQHTSIKSNWPTLTFNTPVHFCTKTIGHKKHVSRYLHAKNKTRIQIYPPLSRINVTMWCGMLDNCMILNAMTNYHTKLNESAPRTSWKKNNVGQFLEAPPLSTSRRASMHATYLDDCSN